MSFIKKLGAFIAILLACGYLSGKWGMHSAFEREGEKLVRQLGAKIVTSLGEFSPSCRANAKIDSVLVDGGSIFSTKGDATLFISGKDDSALTIRYRMESSGDKVYVQPSDQESARRSVIQFGAKGCS
ncbi:hypothetical protein [Pseudomonas sp. SWI44]|uniref:hypothetical protein n=1 Tax=Pseudomonas sp. SWI44 TaxID=2083053 RepID=UPI000CE5EBB5|nr:hypothetical protein [Pseudomonas sp. SWI44]AVD86224.1 hypothetical protein C4Q26_03290 [Pseudomonas sp. SWI44]